jgi:hypothetical protein
MTSATRKEAFGQITIEQEITRTRKEVRAKLLMLAKEMLEDDAGKIQPHTGKTFGVSFDMVRHAAEQRAWIKERDKSGFLSNGSQIMAEAQGIGCETRPSKVKSAQRRRIVVFRLQKAIDAEREPL